MSSSEAVAAEEPEAAALEPKAEPEDEETEEDDEERYAELQGCDYSPSQKSDETMTRTSPAPDPRDPHDPPHEPRDPQAAPACPHPSPSGWFGLPP